ncbi:hypothetical protein Moror_13690 [Moniliophthora roreri MCA 2997]|uniref:Uncharacterized protein n=2 Tax=Moniliophthora roreri TaxID=221103 RepID=V2XD21_MONRO|nr:hypothetical protein Moror_13690 [Moniliophthora roreri MCA 2997]KAI3600697.1 hypothetical protein WG66_014160 [Moniliophthora roreri]
MPPPQRPRYSYISTPPTRPPKIFTEEENRQRIKEDIFGIANSHLVVCLACTKIVPLIHKEQYSLRHWELHKENCVGVENAVKYMALGNKWVPSFTLMIAVKKILEKFETPTASL